MRQRKTNNGGLTPEELRAFEVLLLEKRRDILGDVIHMEDETLRRSRTDLSSLPFHMADMGSDNYEIENTLGLMDSEIRLLAEVDDALGRIGKGTYGICEGAGERIPKERLEAIPWARCCVNCAAYLEKGLGAKKSWTQRSAYDFGSSDEPDDDAMRGRWRTQQS